jgi:transposase
MRLELGEQRTRIKNQIRNLAKRSKLAWPAWFTKSGNWSKRSLAWLRSVAAGQMPEVGQGLRVALATLTDLYQELSRQLGLLDQAVAKLSCTPRYAQAFAKLKLLPGVGTLTAMVFLTELGDLDRFANRRQLAAYLGLAPAAYESGERDDRKGHITRQGPARVRHLLCQAAWAAQRVCSKWKAKYEQLKRGSQKRSKVALVAVMRLLAIQMWHTARSPDVNPVGDVNPLGDVTGPPKPQLGLRQKGLAGPLFNSKTTTRTKTRVKQGSVTRRDPLAALPTEHGRRDRFVPGPTRHRV